MKRELRRTAKSLVKTRKILAALEAKRDYVPTMGLKSNYIDNLNSQIKKCHCVIENLKLAVYSLGRMIELEK